MPNPKRVVLIHSPPHGEVPFRHIGLAYLQAVLEHSGQECILFDISLKEDLSKSDFYVEYIRYLSEGIGDMGDGPDPLILSQVTHPEWFPEILPISRTIRSKAEAYLDRVYQAGDVYLFTVNTLTVYFAAALAHMIRQRGGRTVAGGPNTGFAPLRQLLLRLGAFDAVVQGEGDAIVVDLVRWMRSELSAPPPGTHWIEQDHLHSLPPLPPVGLDELPPPVFRGTLIREFVPILSSRGCPRKCSFCSETSNWVSWRFRNAASVVAEMDARAAQFGCTSFHFHDDSINGSLKFMDQFCELLTAKGSPYTWESFCCPEGLDDERLTRMRTAGCVLLKVGVQSFSPNVLLAMRRRPDPELLKRSILFGASLGISIRFDMLIGFPGETDDDHQKNLEALNEILSQAPEVYFSPNPFYLSLGSETMLNAESYGIQIRYFDPSQLPEPARQVVQASGQFPVGHTYGIQRSVLVQRMRDMGEILSRQNKDYQYLGRT